jgi:integrase
MKQILMDTSPISSSVDQRSGDEAEWSTTLLKFATSLEENFQIIPLFSAFLGYPMMKYGNSFLVHDLQKEDARTQAMILLAYDGALRREELMSLRMDDIDSARGIITIRPETTKNGRMRYVPVSTGVLHLVRRYIEGDRRALIAAYDGDDTGPIFLSESTRNPGHPLAVGAFDEIIERVRERVGLPALTPHTLRHQRCTILKRAGVDLDDIALFAGHKSTKTTRIYIHLAPTELSKRIRSKVETFDAPIRTLIAKTIGQEVSGGK